MRRGAIWSRWPSVTSGRCTLQSMSLLSATARIAALGLFAAACGAGGAVAAVTGVPQVRDALRGPVGLQGSIGRNGTSGPPGQDAVSVDPERLKRDVVSDLSQSSCLKLGTQVSVVTSAAVSPFDTFGRPSLDLTKQIICVLT